MTTPVLPRLLTTVGDTAAALSMSERYVYELIYSGAIESTRVGRSRRIFVDSVESYVEGLRSSA